MTPSNASTSGLEVVAWRVRYVGDQTVGGENSVSKWFLSPNPQQSEAINGVWDKQEAEPLVTAASAQAAIDAEKARADRLAKALERIGTIPLPEGDKSAWKYVHLAKRLARAALQQER